MSRSFLFLTVGLVTAAAVLAGSCVYAQSAGAGAGPAMSAPAKSPETAKMEEAIKHLSQGDRDGCVKLLEDIEKSNPKFPSPYMILYQFMGRAGRINDAKSWLEEGAYKRRTDPEPWIVLGVVALSENRMAEADLDFAKANSLLEQYKNVERKSLLQQQLLLNMASAAERRANWPLAQQRLEEYLKSVPDDVQARGASPGRSSGKG